MQNLIIVLLGIILAIGVNVLAGNSIGAVLSGSQGTGMAATIVQTEARIAKSVQTYGNVNEYRVPSSAGKPYMADGVDPIVIDWRTSGMTQGSETTPLSGSGPDRSIGTGENDFVLWGDAAGSDGNIGTGGNAANVVLDVGSGARGKALCEAAAGQFDLPVKEADQSYLTDDSRSSAGCLHVFAIAGFSPLMNAGDYLIFTRIG